MMYHHIVFFIPCIIPLIVVPSESFTCIHDKIQRKKSSSFSPRSAKKYTEIIEEREKAANLFEPLEVFFYFDVQEESFSTNSIYNIRAAVKKIKSYISNTFQVRKRPRPYLLQRESCTKRWQTGKNRGKCANYKDGIETCASPEGKYEIPDKFLDKLEVYDETFSIPRFVLSSGSGLLQANFIAFITSHASKFCEEEDIFAFAVDCRVHPETNEPLAGILNLCPGYFKNSVYPSEHYFNVILHELFHMLGFTTRHFERYLPCQRGVNCTIPRSVVQEDSNGTFRLMFPHVIKSMQKHFNCSNPDFGAPIDVGDEGDNSTTSVLFTSHWNPILMYSSIMMPKFTENEYIYVDNITLATFASTGWYRVNFPPEDDFEFGKGEGCEFGIKDSCNGSKFLCDPNDTSTSCDMHHKTISKCTTLTSKHPCGVYQPYSTGENCEDKVEDTGFGLNAFERVQQKCLVLKGSEMQAKPTCLPVKCMANSSYRILVNDLNWTVCSNESETTLQDNFTIECVDYKLFCSGYKDKILRQDCAEDDSYCGEIKEKAQREHCTEDNVIFFSVRIYFTLPPFDDLRVHRNFKNFKVSLLKEIAKRMSIPVNYLMNASLYVFKKTYLDFSICPHPSLNFSEFSGKLKVIQKFLDSGSLVTDVKGPKDMIASSTDIQLLPSFATAFSDFEGFKALIIFPTICALFVIVTFIASLGRFLFTLINKPKRVKDKVELNDLPASSSS